ncbi:MAG: protein-L-isoaspartate(D-aspartate) O-methyltransferase [Deltaproteobacteria bacterium]|jgi:protein-L-isoaspartate(D-aspartate) O-methyltransferase|nr:protein-L-isoaspartate(D-aspartate) O-methyltransferase [Deltaproteobacteria bacterium]
MKKPILAFALVMFFTSPGFADNASDSAELKKARERMVQTTIKNRGVSDPDVLAAMQAVPRHRFVPRNLESVAYTDRPLPIGEGQTISQPYVVALMTEILQPEKNHRILEIGTGSGYQAAVLAQVVSKVYTIEIKEKLYNKASKTLKSMGYDAVQTRHSDGYFGWPEQAPFDAIMITAAIDHVPPPLLKQLKDGGRLALPLGNPFSYQNLVLVTKQGEDLSVKQITGVLFVPMTGYALKKPSP